MKPHFLHRATSFVLALVLTLGLFGGIDHLAGREDASALWAAAVMAPRG